MNLHQLEYFVAAAESLNFTKAAEKYYVSQTAVTQQIKLLESHLQVQLFERGNRRVRLTEAGKVYFEEARVILRRVSEAERKVRLTDSGYTGTINIGFLKGCEQLGLASLVSEFKAEYPQISFRFQKGDYFSLFQSLNDYGNDVVFNLKGRAALPEGLGCWDFRQIDQSVLLPSSHPLAGRTRLKRIELQNEKFVLLKTSNELISEIQSGFASAGFIPYDPLYASDMESLLLMVCTHAGIALLPDFDLHLLNGFPMLRAVTLEDDPEEFMLSIFWNTYHCSPATKRFITFLKDKLQETRK